MRSFSKILFAIISGIAVLWITAPDIITSLIHGLPKNSVQLNITPNEQHFHFSHSATGTAWLLWIVILLVGWKTKRWGKRQLQIGAVAGFFGALPLMSFINLGVTSLMRITHRWDWIEVLLVILAVLVIQAKLTVWRYWWRLAIIEPKTKTRCWQPGVEDRRLTANK